MGHNKPLKMKVLLLFISACLYLAAASPVNYVKGAGERVIPDVDYDDAVLTGALKQALFKNFIISVERDAMRAYNKPFSAYDVRKRSGDLKRAAPEMDMSDLADLFKATRG